MEAEPISLLAGFLVGFVALLGSLVWRRDKLPAPSGAPAAAQAPLTFEPVAERLPPAIRRLPAEQPPLFEAVDPEPRGAVLICWVCGQDKTTGDHTHQ